MKHIYYIIARTNLGKQTFLLESSQKTYGNDITKAQFFHDRKKAEEFIREEMTDMVHNMCLTETCNQHELKSEAPKYEILEVEVEFNVPVRHPASELQDRLVQCCLDYIHETHNTEIERVAFTANSLQISAKYGSWQPCTDSSCQLEGFDNNKGFYRIDFSA